MRAVVYDRYGPPEVLGVTEIEKPTPGTRELLIRVHATTVTRGDVRMRRFTVPPSMWIPSRLILGVFRPRRRILGMELAGAVEAVGSGVTAFKPGDEVLASTFPGLRFGGHAEYVCLPEDGMVVAKPVNATYDEAAPIPSGGPAALGFLKTAGEIRSGRKLLIHGASGALGTYAVQLARYFGADVTGVCSGANADLVRSLGAQAVVDYTKEDFTNRSERYDVIFDTIGNVPKPKATGTLKPGGRFISIYVRHPDPTVEDLRFFKQLVEDGHVRAAIDRRYPLEQIVEAHRYVERGHKKGNVVITLE